VLEVQLQMMNECRANQLIFPNVSEIMPKPRQDKIAAAACLVQPNNLQSSKQQREKRQYKIRRNFIPRTYLAFYTPNHHNSA
jgi:hypothetical protein